MALTILIAMRKCRTLGKLKLKSRMVKPVAASQLGTVWPRETTSQVQVLIALIANKTGKI